MAKTTTKFYQLYRAYWRAGPLHDVAMEGNALVTLVLVYLLSSPRGNMAGIYEIYPHNIASELSHSVSAVEASLNVLQEKNIISCCKNSGYIWIRHMAAQELQRMNKKQVTGLFNLLDELEYDQCAPFVHELRDELHQIINNRDTENVRADVLQLEQEVRQRLNSSIR